MLYLLSTHTVLTQYFESLAKRKKNLSHDLTPQYSASFWFLHCDYLENKVTCFNNLTRTQLERNPKSLSGQSKQWKRPCQLHPTYKHYLLKQNKSGGRPSRHACVSKTENSYPSPRDYTRPTVLRNETPGDSREPPGAAGEDKAAAPAARQAAHRNF